eukprot:Skav223326  [mRNA]  locus=scaffold200:116306:116648:- [translate_table: standard]
MLHLKSLELGAEAGQIQVIGRVEEAMHQQLGKALSHFVQQDHGTPGTRRATAKDEPGSLLESPLKFFQHCTDHACTAELP